MDFLKAQQGPWTAQYTCLNVYYQQLIDKIYRVEQKYQIIAVTF
jgi:hypothetical protein